MSLKQDLMASVAVTPLHAELSASTADRWWHCPGSIRLIRLLIALPAPSIYALRGTAMHKAAGQWLSTGREPDWSIETWDGFELEEDEIEAVTLYVETVREDQDTFGGELVVEHRFSLEKLRAGMFGTNDAMLLRCQDKVLRVYDFKGGAGIPVEVVQNLQELYYGTGALLTVPNLIADEIELIIAQPRARHADGPVRRWRIDLVDTADWSQDLLDAAARTDDPNAPLHAGEWCRFCPAAGTCPEYERYALHSASLDFDVIEQRAPLPDPKLMTPEQTARLMPMLSILEDWIGLVRSFAHGEAEAGRVLPGYKLVAKRGRRQWNMDESQVVGIMTQLGVTMDALYKRELKSPAQVEKLLRKPDRPVVNKCAVMVSNGTNLVPVEDPRPAVQGTGLAVFAPIPGGHSDKEDDTS